MATKQEIENFLNGNGSPEELEKVKKALRLQNDLPEILEEDEWNQFVATDQLNSDISNDLLKNLRKEYQQPGSVRVIRMMKKLAVAAALIGIALVGWWIFNINSKSSEVLQAEMASVQKKPHWIVNNNHSGKPITITLSDQTKIVLYNNSQLRYQDSFLANRRDIELIGEADFVVFKDKSRPFSVRSGEVLTKVLGTIFNIKTFEKAGSIRVRLFEGSVLIKRGTVVGKRDSLILKPGQEYFLDKPQNRSVVRLMMLPDSKSQSNPVKNKIGSSVVVVNNWFQFDNQSLPDVFDQLEEMYGVRIEYKRKEIQNMYFIGKFEKGDSLQNILETIATLNRLHLRKEADKFIIAK